MGAEIFRGRYHATKKLKVKGGLAGGPRHWASRVISDEREEAYELDCPEFVESSKIISARVH